MVSSEREVTERELGLILRSMYDHAPEKERVLSIHLFGIKYGVQIASSRLHVKEILRVAELPTSYQTEINKGIHLASYVTINEERLWKY